MRTYQPFSVLFLPLPVHLTTISEDDLSTFPFILCLSAEYASKLWVIFDSGGDFIGLVEIETEFEGYLGCCRNVLYPITPWYSTFLGIFGRNQGNPTTIRNHSGVGGSNTNMDMVGRTLQPSLPPKPFLFCTKNASG